MLNTYICVLCICVKTALSVDTTANTQNRPTDWPEKAGLSNGLAVFFFDTVLKFE